MRLLIDTTEKSLEILDSVTILELQAFLTRLEEGTEYEIKSCQPQFIMQPMPEFHPE